MIRDVHVHVMTTDLDSVPLEDEGLRRLLEVWRAEHARRGGLPARADIDVAELRACLGHLHLLDVVEHAEDYVYRVYGSLISTYYGRDMTGKRLSDFPPATWAPFRNFYGMVVRERVPVFSRIDAVDGVSLRCSDRLAVPLSKNGSDVNQIMVAQYPRGFRRVPDRII